ncbi:MAG: ABC transporter permease subunit [Caldilineaceae bacterium]
MLALVLVIVTIGLLFATQVIQGRRTLYRSGTGIRRPHRVVLGRWRWVALLFCGLVILGALVMPTTVIIYWFVRGLTAGESFQPLWYATFNSIQASTLAALVSVCFALPVAYLAVRYPTRLARWLSRLVYMGYGLPGIVIALSLVFFGANYLTPLYQTLAMLIFAYTVRFLPQAMGALRANLLQISPRLEEAGRSLGLTQRQTLWQVTAPLLRPGLWTSIALVFLSTIKELPATLLLGPTGFSTLATEIWSATAEAFFARAAAPALLLLLVSTLSIVIVLQQEERGVS